MKRLNLVSIILVIIVLVVLSKATINKLNLNNNTVDDKLSNIQSELDKYKKKEQEDKVRKLELQQLQNPNIIIQKLNSTGKLLIYKGEITYNDLIKQSSFWGSKELNLNIKYNFGISYDLSNVKIDSFIDRKVVILIPKQELKLEYLELDNSNNDNKIEGSKTWFESNFTPDDVNMVLQQAREKTIEKINNDKSIYDQALVSLKNNLKELILKLNYEDVIFNEE